MPRPTRKLRSAVPSGVTPLEKRSQRTWCAVTSPMMIAPIASAASDAIAEQSPRAGALVRKRAGPQAQCATCSLCGGR
eukprot:12923627-Alexandrium_andersonii.AAC.1